MKTLQAPKAAKLLLPTLILASLGGCASVDFVEMKIAELNALIAAANSKIGTNTTRIGDAEKYIKAVDNSATTANSKADEALTGVSRLGKRVDAASESLASASSRIGGIDNTLVSTNKRIDQVAGEVVNTNQHLAATKEAASKAGAQLEVVATQIDLTQKQVKDYSNTVQNTSGRLSAVGSELNDVKAKTLSNEEKIGSTNLLVNDLQSQWASTHRITTKNTDAIAATASRVDNLYSGMVLGSSKEASAETAKRLSQIDTFFTTTKTRVDANEKAIASAHDAIAAADKRNEAAFGSVNQAIDANGKRVAELSSSMTTAAQWMATNEKGINAANASIAETSKRLSSLDTGLASTNSRVDANEKGIADGAKRLGSLDTGLASALSRVEANEKGIADGAKRLSSFDTSLASTNSRVDANEKGIADGAKHLGSLDAGLASALSRVEANEKVIADGAKRLSSLDTGLASTNSRVDANEKGIAKTNDSLAATQSALQTEVTRITKLETDLNAVSTTSKEALERANSAHKLAEGKLVYEVELTDDALAFNSDSSALPEAIKNQLSAFADQLKSANKNVYIEIQGHTDSSGSETANLELGMQRAQAVMNYLHTQGGLPLHRMSAVSYGEAKPIAENARKEGRMKNRRVSLVVLK
ncbi:MAG: OmpA family protein [Hydrogenophilales bacterium]|nr:OmpA family protein [Hydrogenophilales bacterium]